jgi:hypothetical protein
LDALQEAFVDGERFHVLLTESEPLMPGRASTKFCSSFTLHFVVLQFAARADAAPRFKRLTTDYRERTADCTEFRIEFCGIR